MYKKDKLKLIEFKLDKINGDLEAVSIVEDPAIEQTFQMFNTIEKQKFIQTSEKQELTGPAMIPNIPILRQDLNGEFFNCYFSDETVKECASIFLRNNNHNRANFEHTNEFYDDIHVIESWFVTDPEKDKATALGFKDVKKGSWFLTYKVDTKETWNKIKNSNFTGFSIEGFFNFYSKIKSDELNNIKKIYSVLMSNLSESDKIHFISKYIK